MKRGLILWLPLTLVLALFALFFSHRLFLRFHLQFIKFRAQNFHGNLAVL